MIYYKAAFEVLFLPVILNCSWCLQVHTKESSVLSMQEKEKLQDFTWIPADELSLQMAAPKLIPLKSSDSSPLKMQLYVEESALKKQ
ncbi:hypothetical protein LSH36_1090g00026 [Paralvinella palmiformis]|uniref:Uncharacterized protein n=1 Tax=Paralvinella palmiformis TaxID=53620 RepID=A0AAD9IV57_9ANNE|nr:hypothetical protein LSH36_1090g00026 [Paralvinella palmiformis]